MRSLLLAGGMVAALASAAWADPATTRVALVPAGPHPYFTVWAQAGADAMRDFHLGAADYKVPASWTLSQQAELVSSLASQGYNAFLIFPGDPVGTRPMVAELADNSVPAIALGGCLQDPSQALFCMGTDAGHATYLSTKALIKAMGGKGRIAHFTGFLVDPNTKIRMDSVARAVAESNGAVTLVQTIADIELPEVAQDKINAFLATQGSHIDGIITSAWIPAVVSATALRKIGDKRIHMIGTDHDPVVLAAIKDGFVDGTMLQNPYGQGYIGSYAMSRLASGCKINDHAPWGRTAQTIHFIDSGMVIAGPVEVDHYLDTMRAVTKALLTEFDQKYLLCK